MREIYVAFVRTPPEKREMAAIARTAAEMGKLWARLDETLAGKPYVAGQQFTMGDIPAGCWIHSWYVLPIERPELRNVRGWYDRLKTRPAYARHVIVPLT